MARFALVMMVMVAASRAFAEPASPPVVAPAPPPTAVSPPSRHVALRDNFPWWEIVGIGGLAAGNVVLKYYEYDLAAWRGDPLIGSAPGFDKSISDKLYKGPFA